MTNFPFQQKDLLPLRNFISFCKERDVHVTQDLLNKFHRLGIFSPCVMIFPGIDPPLVKILEEGKEKLVYEEDIKKFNSEKIFKEKYYKNSAFSYGRDDCLDWYFENNMATKDIPANIDFKENSTPEMFVKSSKGLNKYRVLFYSKQQIHLLKYIVQNRVVRMNFNEAPTLDSIKESIIIMKQRFSSFDQNFKHILNDFVKFFECLYRIEDIWNTEQREIIEEYKENTEGTKMKKNLRDAELKATETFLNKEYAKKLASENIDCDFLQKVRELLVHQTFTSHEKLENFLIVEAKGNNKFPKGELTYMAEFMTMNKKIEWVFDLLNFKKWVTISKEFFIRDGLKKCKWCGNSFLCPKSLHNKETCSKECGEKYKNENKNKNRRKTKI